MIQAVVFDCFGVLTTDGWLAFKSMYFTEGSESEIRATELNRQADAGLIGHDDFMQAIVKLSGVDPEQASKLINGHVRNEQLFSYIRDKLKPSYKIGLLSNASANYTAELFEPWQVALFDEMTFSFELGTVKPDERMYTTIATKLGALPEECIFIDDRQAFVHGAEQAGMNAVLYENAVQTFSDIEAKLNAHA